MESVEGEKSSGSLPANVQFLESADQEDVGGKSVVIFFLLFCILQHYTVLKVHRSR
jgi:hypothetical protein